MLLLTFKLELDGSFFWLDPRPKNPLKNDDFLLIPYVIELITPRLPLANPDSLEAARMFDYKEQKSV